MSPVGTLDQVVSFVFCAIELVEELIEVFILPSLLLVILFLLSI